MKKYLPLCLGCLLWFLPVSGAFAQSSQALDEVHGVYLKCISRAVAPEDFYKEGLRIAADYYRHGFLSDDDFSAVSDSVGKDMERCRNVQSFYGEFEKKIQDYKAGRMTADALLKWDQDALDALVASGAIPQAFRDVLLKQIKAELSGQDFTLKNCDSK